jgi:hypothetical protein
LDVRPGFVEKERSEDGKREENHQSAGSVNHLRMRYGMLESGQKRKPHELNPTHSNQHFILSVESHQETGTQMVDLAQKGEGT